MKTPVSLVVLGASLLVALSLTAQQPDREAQARALEALRQKMAEMEGAPAPAQPAPPPAAQPAPQAPARPAATPVPAPARAPDITRQANSGFAPAPPPNELDERLRQALEQKLRESGTAPAVAGTPAPAAGSTDPYAFTEEIPPPSAPPVTPAVLAEPTPTSTPAFSTKDVVVSSPAATPPPQMGAIVIADGVSEALNPPPSAISSTKEQKLADLLQQYRANAISPEQYHKQRAEILAGN